MPSERAHVVLKIINMTFFWGDLLQIYSYFFLVTTGFDLKQSKIFLSGTIAAGKKTIQYRESFSNYNGPVEKASIFPF
jgi:tRNA(His) 5'-end guanylyltransferase